MKVNKAVTTKKVKMENAGSPKKLGLRTIVRAETRVRSGCPKSTTSECGINYRGS
jgi:hypothetical protein